MLTIASGILGLGESPNSFGQTLALLITFIGIGIVVNVLIIYAVAQVLAERKENQERQRAFSREQHHRR
jgi:energy-converting hydrogenase Eha subunit E